MGLAVQMYTVRDLVKDAAGFTSTLHAIHQIGYRAVQLSAVGAMAGETPEVSPVQAKSLMDDLAIRCIATHRSFDDLQQNTDREIEFHKTLGCDFVAIGSLPSRYAQEGADGYRRFAAEAAEVAAALGAEGIRFGYHNHAHEFVKFTAANGERRALMDVFIDEAPELLLEIDVYWVQHAGLDPVSVFERLHGRTPVIHLKDKEVVAGDGPVMAPVGEGNLDWSRILPACAKAGVEWYAVEQDTCRRDPLDCLRSSFNYLAAIGLEV
jgi:sugar phosphate isomerase/epimerase